MIKSMKMELKRHELFEGLLAHGKIIFQELGIDEALAEQAALAFVDHICEDWAGQTISFPKDIAYKIAMRDLDIYNYHRGDISATARHFKMTERGVRKVINRVAKSIVDKNQGRLFD